MTESNGRTLAIGDIHGCGTALKVLLDAVAPQPQDMVVVLGDIVDRGPETREAIELLLQLREKCTLITLLGNHEEMMLNALRTGQMMTGWLRYGGLEVIESYGGYIENIPLEHVEFLETAHDYWETETEIFIHGNLEPGVKLEEQNGNWLRWTHLMGIERPHWSGKRIICGHTSQKSGIPLLVLEGWVCIDTYAHGSGALTCLDVTHDLVYQARQNGQYLGCLPLQDFA